MRIIITGGAGFIGSHLITALKNSGYKNLLVIDKISQLTAAFALSREISRVACAEP